MRNSHRIKRSKKLIELVRNNTISESDFIYPVFVSESPAKHDALPNIPYLTIDSVLKICEEVCENNIPGIMIFDITDEKDSKGTIPVNENSFTARLYRTIKNTFKDDLLLFSNSGICSYRADGSCIEYSIKGEIKVEESQALIKDIAVAHAYYGADVIVLTEMVDGQVGKVRAGLDCEGYQNIPIMSLVKGDTCLFKPYGNAMKKQKESVSSALYRNDIMNFNMFKNKIDLEIEEDVDSIIIKPASYYLDLVKYASMNYTIPVGAFQVSGEYVMIQSAIDNGYFNKEEIVMESLICIKRAGANFIFSYFSLDAAKMIQNTRKE